MVVEFKMENMDTRQPLENIKISEICRACFESCEKYKMLFEDAESGGKLSLGDVFFEVVKIESKPDIESSPVRICHPCSKDLLNAYSFIQKSKQNNIRLMDYLKKASIKQPDCLSESPIDIPCASGAADFLQIKIEDEVVSEYLYPEDNASALLSSDSESDDDQPLLHKINKMQCTYCNRVFKRLDFFENHKRKHEQELSNKGSTEDSLKASCDEGELSSNSKQKMMTHPTTSHTTRMDSSERESSNSSAKQNNSVDKSDETIFRLRGNDTAVNPQQQTVVKGNPEILMLQLQINNLKETCLKEFQEIKELILNQNTVKKTIYSKEIIPVVKAKPEKKDEQHIPFCAVDNVFPINTDDQLHTLNNVDDNHKCIAISTVKKLICNGGLCVNMNKVFGNWIVVNYNYEGNRGKKSLKDLAIVNEILFRAAFNNGYTTVDYENDLRRGFKIMKNRYYKNECIRRKKTDVKNVGLND